MKTLSSIMGLAAAAVAALLLLSACQYADPAGIAALEAVGREMLAKGTLTQEQFDAMMGGLHSPGGPDWGVVAAIAGNTALAFLGIPPLIKYQAKKAGSRLGGGSNPS